MLSPNSILNLNRSWKCRFKAQKVSDGCDGPIKSDGWVDQRNFIYGSKTFNIINLKRVDALSNCFSISHFLNYYFSCTLVRTRSIRDLIKW